MNNPTAMKEEHRFSALKDHKGSPTIRHTSLGAHISFAPVSLLKSASNSPVSNQ